MKRKQLKARSSDTPDATEGQKIAMYKVLRGVPVKDALAQAGYAPDVKHDHLRKTRGFMQLIDKHLPESTLVRVHKDGLEATRLVGQQLEEVPDYNMRFRYLELAYKLRGKLTGDAVQGNTINISIYNEDQLRRVAARIIRDDGNEGERTPHGLLNSGESEVHS